MHIHAVETNELQELARKVVERANESIQESGRDYTVRELFEDCIDIVEECNLHPSNASTLLWCLTDMSGGYFQKFVNWNLSYERPTSERVDEYFESEWG